ncbi:MAG: metal ABC transporter ATP-binding protein [Candidatus Limiplasma sp.]|nr:metal ABC transporter ATP-binding protein [Candidatus Limiplasma sp.]
MSTIIQATGLRFQYAKEPIFSDVSFRIDAGDFVALTGANGAGKSTLLKLLLGELAPEQGSIQLFGEDIARFRQWPKVGYMPQNGTAVGANFPATVFEIVMANLFSQIGLMRMPKQSHRAQAMAALAQVGMAEYAKRPFSMLSGGQPQRVLLARVLVNAPEIMILDEPTAGIDSKGIDDLLCILSDLNRTRHASILRVTKDLARAAQFASRTLCLEEGSLVELSETQVQLELKHKHHHDHACPLA